MIHHMYTMIPNILFSRSSNSTIWRLL